MKPTIYKFFSCILAVFIGFTTMISLAGCHGSKREITSFEVPESFDTSKQHEITFWAKNDTNKIQTEIYNKAIQDFETIYPNIKVNLRLYTDYSKIYNDVITNIATDTTPNVCITYPDHIATYISGGDLVVPLDDFCTDKAYGLGGSEVAFDAPTLDEMIPQFLEECKLNGQLYGMPYMRSTEACYINEDYVHQLGYEIPDVLTWDFIWEVSEAATAKNADGTYVLNGQNVMIPFLYKSTDNMMIQILKQQNAPYSTESGDILLFHDTTKEILKEIASHTLSGAFSTFKISGYPANFLNAGQCVFAVDSTAGSTWMGSDAPLVDIPEDNIVKFHTVVKPIPQYDPEHPKMLSQGPSICIFDKKEKQEVLASWLFVQYLLTNEVQIAYSQTEGYAPVTLKAQQSEEYVNYLNQRGQDFTTHYPVKIDATKILLEHTADTFTAPVFNGSTSLREASAQLIEETVKSVKRKKTIDDSYFSALFADTTSLYRLDQISSVQNGKENLGPLPLTAKLLLGGLTLTWCIIFLSLVFRRIKKSNRKNRQII